MRKLFLATVAALIAGTVGAHAFSLSASSLNTNVDPDASTDWFDITVGVNGDGTVTFSIGNLVATGNTTKISTVYLGTDGGTPNDPSDGFYSYFENGAVGIAYSGTANYSVDWDPNGGGQITNHAGWSIQVEGDPATGNDKSLINPGEALQLTFELLDSNLSEQDIIDAFNSDPQQLGIAFHVQSIPGGYSEWYQATPGGTTSVPDGGATVMLLGMAVAGLGVARRFLKV